MAIRIGKCVRKAEIDNRLKDYVVGKLWLKGRKQPISLNLRGNCLRDIAGFRLVLEGTSPEPDAEADKIAAKQQGVVGDMTASRKVKATDLPVEEAWRLRREGKDVPCHMANCLYLEWFSEQNGRIVLETTDFRVTGMSGPEWHMSKAQEEQQLDANERAIRDYIEHMNTDMEEVTERWSEGSEAMDEFEWEKALRESDALTEKFADVFEKYLDHPNREQLIAREMGWDWLDDALDADARGLFDDDDGDPEAEDVVEPNPLTEGKDWVRTGDGDIAHPLAHRASLAASRIWNVCDKRGLIGEDGDSDVHEMCFQAHMLSAKLAGALNGLAYDDEPENGFVVAYLKRAHKFFLATLSATAKVEPKHVLAQRDIAVFRKELFEIRQELLQIMQRYRSSS